MSRFLVAINNESPTLCEVHVRTGGLRVGVLCDVSIDDNASRLCLVERITKDAVFVRALPEPPPITRRVRSN